MLFRVSNKNSVFFRSLFSHGTIQPQKPGPKGPEGSFLPSDPNARLAGCNLTETTTRKRAQVARKLLRSSLLP